MAKSAVTQSYVPKTIEEMLSVVKALRENKNVISVAFSGSYNSETNVHSERFNVTWDEKKEVPGSIAAE